MRTLQRGEKAKLGDLGLSDPVVVGVAVNGPATYDISCFGIDANGKLIDDRYMVFYNQTSSPAGEVTAAGPGDGDRERFTVKTAALPAWVERLVFTVTIDGSSTMRDVQSGYVRLSGAGTESARYAFSGADFAQERAIMAAELYRRDGTWRINAVGQGFNGGLGDLLKHFGGEVADATPTPGPSPAPLPTPPTSSSGPNSSAASAPSPTSGSMPTSVAGPTVIGSGPGFVGTMPVSPGASLPAPSAPAPFYSAPAPAPIAAPPPAPIAAPPPAPTTAPTGAEPPRVNLGKITLDKRGDARTVNLTKSGGNPMHVNLNWRQQVQTAAPRRFLRGSSAPSGGADLDLGCMWETKDGLKSVIQPLGERFGDRNGPPWIILDKDDRSGAAADGENLQILRPEELRRVLVFAMIYGGASGFAEVGGTLTIRDATGSETVVHLSDPAPGLTFCAVAQIINDGGSVRVVKEERYFKDAEECDNAFGFGFRWRVGQK